MAQPPEWSSDPGGNPYAGHPEYRGASYPMTPDPYPGAWAGGLVHPPIRQTNTLAIIALVAAFVFPPVAIVLGIVARSQIRQTGEDGAGLALAGLIIGSLFTAIFVVFLLLWIALFAAVFGAAATVP